MTTNSDGQCTCVSKSFQSFSGAIKSLSISGNGPNSAEIVVNILVDAKNEKAFRIGAYLGTESSVFAAMSGFLTQAYFKNELVHLKAISDAPNTTLRIVSVSTEV